MKASSGPRYVVGCRNKVDKDKLAAGTRVALDMTTLTIMRALPREVSLPRGCWKLKPCCCAHSFVVPHAVDNATLLGQLKSSGLLLRVKW